MEVLYAHMEACDRQKEHVRGCRSRRARVLLWLFGERAAVRFVPWRVDSGCCDAGASRQQVIQ